MPHNYSLPEETTHIRFIGDVHGHIATSSSGPPTSNSTGRSYLSLIKSVFYSVQVGDFGFRYGSLAGLNANRHRIVAGNHDNYEDIPNYSHFLGNFGSHEIPLYGKDPFRFFFIRGARSIDKDLRRPGLSWWPEEELNYVQSADAYEAYTEAKPALVVTHDCPAEIVQLVAARQHKLPPSSTNSLLQACYEAHPPDMWIFGHHHRDWMCCYDGRGVTAAGRRVDNGLRKPTVFICLDELGYLDFNKRGVLMQGTPS